MHLAFFSAAGWKDWGLGQRPLIRQAMPVLVDDDLLFEDEYGPRATVPANQWLRELPVSGVPAVKSWEVYARALKGWLEFLAERGVPPFGLREQLRAGLGMYAEHRLAGPVAARWAESTWNLNVGVLAQFYEWAVAEGHAPAVPFSYAMAVRVAGERRIEVRRNLARLRQAKPHTTIKYLEADFAQLITNVLEGMLPDGAPDSGFRGMNPGRNSAMTQLALTSGLRRQEFTYLLEPEIPALPPEPTALPIPLLVAAGIAKGRKQRTTWVDYDALVAVHRYLDLERSLAVQRSAWQPAPDRGGPLVVTDADWRGGVVNGRRVAWSRLAPSDRLRLVDQNGGSLLLAVRRDGAPFLDWSTVLRRASTDIRTRFEPRFPHVHPHRLRHTFAMTTLERLVAGYYRQAAKLVADTDGDAAMALYLTQADPMMVLRDLLGHSSVTVTEIYLSRLDTTRVFRDAYERAGRDAGLLAEVEAEFADDLDDDVDEEVNG